MLIVNGLRRLHLGPVHLRVAPGECVAIAGPSGAGKSVLLRMLADLDPHEGEVTLDGVACSAMPAPAWRRMVTYVAAESGWWAERVGAHFASEADLAGLLPQLGMAPDAANWPVSRLSTGERQRLALLRALTPGNRVLLLDEPTSGLDPDSTDRVEALLQQCLSRGTSILMVTHSAAQAERMATRHLTLKAGGIEEVGA